MKEPTDGMISKICQNFSQNLLKKKLKKKFKFELPLESKGSWF